VETTNHTTSFPVRFRALATALLVCLALAACGESDPVESIRQLQAAGDFKSTVEPLRELLKTRPDDGEINFLYGRALSFTQPNLAVWSLRKAMDDPEWLIPAGSQLAYLALTGDDFNEVIKITGRILERDPDNVRALLMRANAYAHSKQNPELALADAKHVLEIDRDATEAYEPLILALLGQGKLKEAGEALDEAGRRVAELGLKDDVAAWHCVTTSVFQQEQGNLELARKTMNGCLEKYPTSVDVVSSAVNFHDAQGERERSLEILRAAQKGAPANRTFRVALSQRLQASGESAEAEAILREATETQDAAAAASAWIDLAKFRQETGDYGGGADALERVVELGKEDEEAVSPQLLFEYADALILAERFDRALEVAEDLEVPAHQHLIRGRVAQERRQPAQALEEFDKSLKLWPDNAGARYYAATAAEELGDFERAIEEYRNSIRVEPGATDARLRGAALLSASGNPGGGLLLLQTAIDKAPLEIEGLLLGMRLCGLTGNVTGFYEILAVIQARYPSRAGQAIAEAAEGLVGRNAPALALSMLTTTPGVDLGDPSNAPVLRGIVESSHRVGHADEARRVVQKIRAAHPDSSVYQEIHALDLELSGAPPQDVKAAYARALELDAGNARALAALGRLTAGEEPEKALALFDRAAAADPSDADAKLAAARILIATGKPGEAEQRLDALLIEHPFEGAAAAERARLDLEKGVATPQTLERARRAVRFGGGADALDLLSRVHEKRQEPDLAARAAKEARALREVKTPEDKG
jgi:tetratricopeptide (TPR) repeat protein